MRKAKRELSAGPTAGDYPDTWRPLRGKDGNTYSATYVCPFGHHGSLEGHKVWPDGRVEPSVKCPEDGCTFHDTVHLLAWPPEASGKAPRNA